MDINTIKEQIRIAEANGDTSTAQELREKLNQMTING
jgi:hypothetical protein